MKLLEKEMIELNQQFANKEEAIRYCGKKNFVEAGYVDPEYVNAMIERDAMLSVYMGNFIAIPHGQMKQKKYVKNLVSALFKCLKA